MRKTVLVILLSVGVISCKKNAPINLEQKLIGKWSFNYAIQEKPTGSQGMTFTPMSASYYNFSQNGEIGLGDAGGEVQIGNWSISNDIIQLKINNSLNYSVINEFTTEKFIFSQEYLENGQTNKTTVYLSRP